MKSVKILLLLIAAILICYFGIRMGGVKLSRRSVEEVVDTLRYEGVVPDSIEPYGGDSIYYFRDSVDSRWSAEIVGSNVELRSLVLLDPVEREPIYRDDLEWEVSLKGGIYPGAAWVGVGVTRNYGGVSLTLDGGYNSKTESPYVGLSASVPIWRKRR